MKLVQHSNSICDFCGEKVTTYFTNLGMVICKSCVKEATKIMEESE